MELGGTTRRRAPGSVHRTRRQRVRGSPLHPPAVAKGMECSVVVGEVDSALDSSTDWNSIRADPLIELKY